MGLITQLKGLVSRTMPVATPDNTEADLRLWRDGSITTIGLVRKQTGLAAEGSYFTVNNAQTGLATAAAPTTFSATNPFVLIYNTDSPTNSNYKRIELDILTLIATAAGTAGASVQFAVTIDSGNRYSSGGTNLTANIVNPNMDAPTRSSVANVYAGNVTAAAATAAARTVVGNRFCKAAIPVAGDTYSVNFGGVEGVQAIGVSTVVFSSNNVPPVIIGPNQSALVHLWLPSQSAASSYAPELSWFER